MNFYRFVACGGPVWAVCAGDHCSQPHSSWPVSHLRVTVLGHVPSLTACCWPGQCWLRGLFSSLWQIFEIRFTVFLLTSSFPYYSCYFSFSYVRLGCELRYAFEDLAICCFLSAFFVFVVISYPHLDNFPSCLCLIYFMTVWTSTWLFIAFLLPLSLSFFLYVTVRYCTVFPNAVELT